MEEPVAGPARTTRVIEGRSYLRIPVRTKLILRGEPLLRTIEEALADAGVELRLTDLLFVSEKAVSASQGRYYLLDSDELRPRFLARFLSRFVTRTPAGIGLGMPETMECALRECGTGRILFASVIGALGKLVGRKGDFYRIAGPEARSIDGPTTGTIPPFNRAVSLGPERPDIAAQRLSKHFGVTAAVVDINDLGGNILGIYPERGGWSEDLVLAALADNPLGQGHHQTPVGILREQDGS
ncbi:coenzyme F420-0:L-glutamate ligase [Candidatus Fermentibacterales bacterium]|nr:coenzyme F420-0:L-glutamate ligase [Candidatus Fermentibacterales bacterium]